MPLAQSPGEVAALAGAGPEAAIGHVSRVSGGGGVPLAFAQIRACAQRPVGVLAVDGRS
jgi:hypothetical protein